jgi:hypothetical protein
MRRRRSWENAQAMVEFSLVVPIFIAIIFGALIIYSWQLDLDSAQFAAQEGVQVVAIPSQVDATLCSAGNAALQALNKSSFLGGTPPAPGSVNGSCGLGPSTPDYHTGKSCPNDQLQTYSTMRTHLNASVPANNNNTVMICAACLNLSKATPAPCDLGVSPTDEVEIQVTVVGYKPLPIAFPVFGKRMTFYGQNSQTLQAFTS